jgi:hypothetical protein
VSSPVTYIISVSSIPERDKLIKKLYSQLTVEPDLRFTTTQDQVNRIRIYHNVATDIRVLIRTYLVLVVPLIIDLRPLLSLTGTLDFDLSETICLLQSTVNKLQAMQGRRVVNSAVNLEGLFESLRGEY